MLNTKSLKFEQDVVKIINEAELPPIVIELTLSKLLTQVNSLTNQTIAKEAEAAAQEAAKEETAK